MNIHYQMSPDHSPGDTFFGLTISNERIQFISCTNKQPEDELALELANVKSNVRQLKKCTDFDEILQLQETLLNIQNVIDISGLALSDIETQEVESPLLLLMPSIFEYLRNDNEMAIPEVWKEFFRNDTGEYHILPVPVIAKLMISLEIEDFSTDALQEIVDSVEVDDPVSEAATVERMKELFSHLLEHIRFRELTVPFLLGVTSPETKATLSNAQYLQNEVRRIDYDSVAASELYTFSAVQKLCELKMPLTEDILHKIQREPSNTSKHRL